jgi:hypothetical protein
MWAQQKSLGVRSGELVIHGIVPPQPHQMLHLRSHAPFVSSGALFYWEVAVVRYRSTRYSHKFQWPSTQAEIATVHLLWLKSQVSGSGSVVLYFVVWICFLWLCCISVYFVSEIYCRLLWFVPHHATRTSEGIHTYLRVSPSSSCH